LICRRYPPTSWTISMKINRKQTAAQSTDRQIGGETL
jgi:hypothetical protein